MHTCTFSQVTAQQSRAERKEQTRRALLDGALKLATVHGFSGVSLREVARAADIVPTGFYRHFDSLDDLGLALVDESTRALKNSLRDARRGPNATDADQRLSVFIDNARKNPDLFRFVYRERYGGAPRIRRAIETELRLIIAEIAIDLSRQSTTSEWDTEDLEMAADLIVSAMLDALAAYHTANPADKDDVLDRARKQLRLLLVGVAAWRPARDRA